MPGLLLLPLLLLAAPAAPAHASTQYVGARILDRAESHLNAPYAWGGTGPAYDCSGLVFAAATSLGITGWPRDTFDIAAEIGSRFVITSRPVRGDLALWGPVSAPYHVEMVTAWGPLVTFGAETPGWAGRVTWHEDTFFRPSFYLHILG